MSIYEYDQEEHIRLEREDAFEDGRKAGKEEGREEGRAEGIGLGEDRKLMNQVKAKLEKNKSIDQIADELEETVSVIQKIIAELQNNACKVK